MVQEVELHTAQREGDSAHLLRIATDELGRNRALREKIIFQPDHESNNYTTPMYLIKAGIAYESLGNYSKAASAYRRITTDHPNCDQIKDAKKYLGRAEALAG